MKRIINFVLLLCLIFFLNNVLATSLPKGFVYLSDIDPSIIQDIRYKSFHNFVGRPIKGYQRAVCILTLPTALALKNIQTELRSKGLALKVYDCYRPVMAVSDFLAWSKSADNTMKTEFYPRENKEDFFRQGYIAAKSGHSRGSTVDLTIVDLNNRIQSPYFKNQQLIPCTAPWSKRFHDNSIDMGSGYDCLDKSANINYTQISQTALANRYLLQHIMKKNNFEPLDKEWWHFTYKNEPFKKRYFNFPVN